MSANFHPYIVPAMDVLISDPDILSPSKSDKKKADYLCIPIQYVDRLDDFYHEINSRGDSARQLLGRLGVMLEHINITGNSYFSCENGMRVEFRNSQTPTNSSRQNAIMLAKSLQRDHDHKGSVAIMTGSDRMIAKAAAAHVDIAHVNPEIYTGRRKVTLPADAVSLWTNKGKITTEDWSDIFGKSEPPLHANEFVEFDYPYTGACDTRNFRNIGRFHSNTKELLPLKYLGFYSPSYREIHPISPVQAMYMEALLAPVDEIPIVVLSGLFGIGKTFLPIAVGLNGVGYGTQKSNLDFRRIFVCPRDSKLGKEIGYLPGDATEKTMAKALPIIDNIYDVLSHIKCEKPSDKISLEPAELEIDASSKKKNRKRKKQNSPTIGSEINKIIDRYFEFQPMINMGGRSISDSLIIYDEFQDVERFQARELVTRIADGSKMVIVGDPTQLSNPHLNRTSNGLNYVANKLADQPYAAVISSYKQEEIIRHWVLQEVAKAFGTHY